ncbi:putative poly(ADP-ribose) glycohydrolase [Arabidopsis thaliana]
MVNSGEALALHIMNMRKFLSLNASDLAPYALQGYALFFDKKISKEESANFFGKLVPALCRLLLQLPSMLEKQYQKANHVLAGVKSKLRLLGPQEAGFVLLSQELIAALLACSFFCLFPEVDRSLKNLQGIKFGGLFSYEILPLEYHPHFVSYPKADSWANSVTPLCSIAVHTSGAIEDQPSEALEVDFEDEYFGGLTPSYDTLEVNKAFIGYMHQCKYKIDVQHHPDASSSHVTGTSDSANQVVESSQGWCIKHEEKKIGIATGN